MYPQNFGRFSPEPKDSVLMLVCLHLDVDGRMTHHALNMCEGCLICCHACAVASVTAGRYEGPNSTNPLSFRYYNADEEILGKPMKDW